MKIRWLIEDYEHDSSLQPLFDEIKRQGMEFKIIKDEPWKRETTFNQFSDEDCVVFHGTLNLGRQLQKEKKWIPGVYCNFKNFYCHTYYSYWGKYLFNQDYIMLPMRELLRRKDEIFSIHKFGIEYDDIDKNDNLVYDRYIFIRPDSGAKPISGQLLKYKDIEKEFKLFETYAGNNLEQIILVVSSPKSIMEEWRCVVVDRKIVAFSQYQVCGKLNISRTIKPGALLLAEKIAKEEWQPDIAYTLDICGTTIDTYHLLEANSFSCSGLYESDPEPIVREISKAALKEWEEYNEKL